MIGANSSTKRVQILALLGVAVFCATATTRFFWLSFGPRSWGPRFACAESTFDFGDLPSKGTVEHCFRISNTGRKVLHILNVTPSCDRCLNVTLSRTDISSGDSVFVWVVVDVERISNHGEVMKAVLLETDDPELKEVVLHIHGIKR
jgi:Protein of unknown function (DUF1573)